MTAHDRAEILGSLFFTLFLFSFLWLALAL